MNLIYKHEPPLFLTLLVISLLVWAGGLFATKGLLLAYIAGFALFYLFAQSAFISHLRGTAVEITPDQMPDLYQRIAASCRKLNLPEIPRAYLLHVGGSFNAMATRFLGRNFIVLFSDVVDALEEHPDALNFYIGHEIGHIRRNHLRWGPLLLPASFLPLVGAAYSRAREYTCDRHGLAACSDAASAQQGLGVLAAGARRWRTMSKDQYASQTRDTSGFWMSLHELIGDYPWLTKRLAAVQALAAGGEAKVPSRHPLAWVLALFVPRLGGGAGAASGLVFIAMLGVLAAVAIPAYQEYIARAKLTQAVQVGRQATAAVSQFYREKNTVPKTLEEAGFVLAPNAGLQQVQVDPNNGVVTMTLSIEPVAGKSIVFIPSLTQDKQIVWRCRSRDVKASMLPQECRE